MNSDAHASHSSAHAAMHADAHGESHAPHVTLDGYLIGFGLSVILTAVPFYLVMSGVLESKTATALAITILAVAQIVVHMVYFLHLDAKSEAGWNLMALIFTAVILIIALTGSLWIMYHLKVNMMPMDMSHLP
ncbi:MAG TPA: cytochrome o ubiquinol oxidase subunit IV [Xanthobacteraceae bacterium]|nr:cytochrome o ubiquinol oxidase subunit IV [Xanthobacteraceae bacterium]